MIRVNGVTKRFGEEPVLDGIGLVVNKEEVVGIVGPNGCGKTTLLRIVAGVERPDSGTVEVGGRLGLVPQDDVLLPWATLASNIGLGLKFRGVRGEELKRRVLEVARLLGIEEHLHKYPRQVSGGTARKASIARALVLGPDVLLLDEPYTGLDAFSISSLQATLKRLNRERGITMLVVSHQLDELTSIADRIYVLSHKPSRVKAVIDLKSVSEGERLNAIYNALVSERWGR
uniref:ATP-binding cassette domain-containing protein n=1 Tax=Fervidicoccus fontis TaxID=683846 RepID=A0A7J3ZIG1_9CREN